MATLTDEQIGMLRSLANRFMMNARDYSRESKSGILTLEGAAHKRGMAEAFLKAANDLASLLKNAGADGSIDRGASDGAADTNGLLTRAPAPITFAEITQIDAIRLLEFAGATPKDVQIRKDNTVFAVFSKLQPIAERERVGLLRKADGRVVIITIGKTKEGGDPFIEFGVRS